MHCGFPISGFNAKSGFIGGTDRIEHGFTVTFNTKHLLESFEKWGARVKNELTAMPEQLNMLQIASEYVEALNRVQTAMLKEYSPRLSKAADEVMTVANHVKDIEGYPHIISMDDKKPEPPNKGFNMHIQQVPLELVELARKIESIEQS